MKGGAGGGAGIPPKARRSSIFVRFAGKLCKQSQPITTQDGQNSVGGTNNVQRKDLHLCDFAEAKRSEETNSRSPGLVCSRLRRHMMELESALGAQLSPLGLDRWRWCNRMAPWKKPANWRRWRVSAHKAEQLRTCSLGEDWGMGMKWPELRAWRAQQLGQVGWLVAQVVT